VEVRYCTAHQSCRVLFTVGTYHTPCPLHLPCTALHCCIWDGRRAGHSRVAGVPSVPASVRGLEGLGALRVAVLLLRLPRFCCCCLRTCYYALERRGRGRYLLTVWYEVHTPCPTATLVCGVCLSLYVGACLCGGVC
jgi:hypothetical protein